MTDDLVKNLRDRRASWIGSGTHPDHLCQQAADRIEWLERERVLDAKLLADTQALLDTALEAVIDAKLVGEAKLAEVEATEDVGILRARVDELQRLNADLTRQVQMQPRRPQDAAPATDAVDALVKAAEEAAEVIHKAYVSATMEAVNAGPSHPLKDNIDKWRVRCLRAEEALRAALTTEKTNG